MEQNYIEKLLNLIHETKDDNELKENLLNFHENDIAKVFPMLSQEERFRLYKVLDQDTISDIFSYLDDPKEYLNEISNEKAADILETMDTDDAIDVLEKFEEEERKELIKLMDKDAVDDINLITSYSEDMIGSKMTTNYIVINKNATVKQAMKKMVEEAAENDNVSTIYFVDDNEIFYGAMDLRDLIIARENQDLKDLIKTSYPYLYATELVSECLGKIQDYSLDSIPVVDDKKALIGVITSEDIVEAVHDELAEDYAKLAGLSSEEDLDESVFKAVKKRIPWLLILVVLDLLVSMLISNFEEVVKVLPIIVFFQSLILDMAGNAGTQSLAVTIRVLSDEKTTNKDIRKLIFKEIRIGLTNGFLIGLLSMIAVSVFLLIFNSQAHETILKVAFVTGLSMLGSMTVASFGGSLIPTIFKKCKIDPAVASGPFITTINDLIAILIYYGLAWILFLN